MSLLENRYYLYLVFAAALIVSGYFSTVSVWGTIMFIILAPAVLGCILRQYLEDHDYSDELYDDYMDAEWKTKRS